MKGSYVKLLEKKLLSTTMGDSTAILNVASGLTAVHDGGGGDVICKELCTVFLVPKAHNLKAQTE